MWTSRGLQGKAPRLNLEDWQRDHFSASALGTSTLAPYEHVSYICGQRLVLTPILNRTPSHAYMMARTPSSARFDGLEKALPSGQHQQIHDHQMSTNFLSLPSELRNKIYEQLLVLEEPIVCPTHPWRPYSLLQMLHPELLLANKTVHREASSLLYAQNHFDLTTCTFEHVASFLDQIGHNNASYIRLICIDFPDFRDLGQSNVTLKDDSVRILAKIQSDCTNLSTLITSLDSTNAMELKLDALDSPRIAGEALALVDARFRAISSLKEVVVKVYEDGPSVDIRKKMEGHGWTINVTERVEESDLDISFSDDDYDYDYDYDYNDYDESDDVFDDDYWRRAGD